MRKYLKTPLSERMSAGKALAIRQTLENDPHASALITASEVLWTDLEPRQPVGFAAKVDGLTNLLTYTDGCFGSPDVEEIAARYIYWTQYVPAISIRPYIHHTVMIRPIAPFRREADANAFADRVKAGRRTALKQCAEVDYELAGVLAMGDIWHYPVIGCATTCMDLDAFNASYHFRCERGAPPPPSIEEIAAELAAWANMTSIAVAIACKIKLGTMWLP